MNCPSCKCDVLPGARYCCSCGRRLVTKTKDSNENKHRFIEGAVGDVVKISPPGPFHSSERHLQLLMDSIPAYISYVDADERYRWVNKKYESWYQRSRHEIIGKTVRELQSDTDYENMRDCIRQALCGVPVRYENSLTDGGGQARFFDTHYLPDRTDDGKVLGFFVLVFDVTNERTARESLRASEARLAESQRIAKLGSWNLDLQTNRLDWSAEIFRIFEVDPKNFGVSYDSFLNAIHPDDRERVNEAYLNSLANREPYEITHRLQMPDGAIKWVEERCETYFDADGQPLRSLGTVLDVTDRKKAETTLRASEERWRTFVDHTADALFIHEGENNGRILDVNRQACESLGYSREELIGKYPTDIDPEITPQRLAQITADLQAGKSVMIDSVHRRKDGSHFPVAIRFRPFEADGRQRVMTTCRDITDRKQAEETLRENEARTRQIIDGLFGFVGLYTLEGTLIEANHAPLRAAGLCREEVLGRPFWDTYWWNYDEGVQAELKAAMAKAARGETVRYEPKVRVLGGALITVDVTFSPLRNNAGDITHILGFGVDITERKRLDEALRRSEEQRRLSMRAAGQGFYDLDLTTGNAEVSSEYVTMIGHDPATFTETNAAWAERLHPDDRPKVYATFEAYLRGELPCYEVEFRQRTRCGRWLWTLSIGSIVSRDENGKPLRMLGTHTNIDVRKQAEEALRVSEQRLLAFLSAIPDVMYRISGDGVFLDKHAQWKSNLYVPPERIIGGRIEEFMPTELASLVLRMIRTTLETGAVQTFEFSMPRPSGVRQYEMRMATSGDDEVVAIARDITENKMAEAERQRAEQALRESRDRLNEITETISEVFWSAKSGITKTLFVSPSFERIWGRSCASLRESPRSFIEAIHPQDRERVISNIIKHQSAGQPFEVEYRIIRPDGSERWIWDRGFPVKEPDGSTSHYVGSAMDITARKVAEETLQAHSQVLLSMAEGVVFLNEQGIILFTNHALDRMSGYGPGELVGQPATILNDATTEENERIIAKVMATMTASHVWSGEFRNRRKDGTVFWTAATISEIYIQNQRRFVSVQQDITVRKQAEVQIDMLRNQLAHAARLGTLGELASGLAHELNQPLAALHLYASTALKLEPGSNREELVDCIQQISKESLRAGEIIRRMRTFAAPATSRRTSVNLNELIEEVLMIVAVNLRHSCVKLLLELDVSLPLVLADRIQIQQVLVNLIRNALDAMAATAEEMRFLTIQTIALSDAVRISVTDTGSGINTSIVDKLFQAFQTTKPNGLGLGLAISRTLIEAHGGQIDGQPNPGGGATFYFFLPYNRESASRLPSNVVF